MFELIDPLNMYSLDNEDVVNKEENVSKSASNKIHTVLVKYLHFVYPRIISIGNCFFYAQRGWLKLLLELILNLTQKKFTYLQIRLFD